MKRFVSAISAGILIAAALTLTFSATAFATEDLPDYTVKGRKAYDLADLDSNGNTVVVSRKVVFSIGSFPLKYDDFNADNVGDYAASVKVDTVYGNVKDKDVVVRTAVPVGTRTDEFSLFDDRYRVAVDGVEIEGTDRYAYRGRYAWSEDAEETVSKLRDERRTDGIYDADTVVTEYVFNVDCGSDGRYDLFVKADIREGLAFFAEGEKYLASDEFIIYRINAEDGDEIRCYAVGGDTDIGFEAEKGGKELSCTVEETGKTETSLAAVADASCVIGDDDRVRVDWFNLLISYLEDDMSDKDSDPFTDAGRFADNYVTRIKEYAFEIKAESNVSCTLTAPLFPDIDENYDPYMYRYEFSAKQNDEYAEGYKTEYIINTPYRLSGLPDAEKTEDGYVITDDWAGICFSLCAEENPKYVGEINTYGNFYADTFIAVHVFWCAEAFLIIVFAAVNIAAGIIKGYRGEKLLKRAVRAVGICIGCLAATAFFAFIALYCADGSGKASVSEVTTIVICTLMSAAVTTVNCGLLKIKNKEGKRDRRTQDEEDV